MKIHLKAFFHCLCSLISEVEYGFSKIITGETFLHHYTDFKGWKCACVGQVRQKNVIQCLLGSDSIERISHVFMFIFLLSFVHISGCSLSELTDPQQPAGMYGRLTDMNISHPAENLCV